MADLVPPEHRRSTPPGFEVVTDSRGKEWKYSDVADVWRVVDNHLGPGSVSATSARSWEKLWAEFGPLTFRRADRLQIKVLKTKERFYDQPRRTR